MATTIQIVRTVVDGAIGELTITYENQSGAVANDVVIKAAHGGAITPNSAGHLGYLPGATEGGYAVGNVAAGATVVRSFAIKPVDAEAGKTYQVDATVTFVGGNENASANVFVEARPEVYAAIGIADTVRAQVLELYNNAKQKGRDAHEGTSLPETRGDPTARALQPTSFQWALQMIELGTKMFRSGGPPRGSGEAEQDP